MKKPSLKSILKEIAEENNLWKDCLEHSAVHRRAARYHAKETAKAQAQLEKYYPNFLDKPL